MKWIKSNKILEARTVWIIELDNDFSHGKTLLISKVSEAILPNTKGNHIGEGATIDKFIAKQPGVRFIINGGYNHYRKNFYEWNHDKFNVGDPVGLVKIREHYFEDMLDAEHFGFFIQRNKQEPWQIVKLEQITREEKYILGCTPLLIHSGQKIELPIQKMLPMQKGEINPPSVLSHGLQNNPRTAVGVKDKKLFFILVEGDDNQGGCTLPELQDIGLELGLQDLLNLDGGGSSQFKLFEDNNWISNYVSKADKDRILGHVIVLFDEALK